MRLRLPCTQMNAEGGERPQPHIENLRIIQKETREASLRLANAQRTVEKGHVPNTNPILSE
jgi:hypothetical protein